MKKSKHIFNYTIDYSIYRRKHIVTKVKKHFMTSKEFLNIYEQYCNIKTSEDFIFVIQLIQTSKTYRHYQTNEICLPKFKINCSINTLIWSMSCVNDIMTQMPTLTLIMQWLYSRTVHTSSLNSVTFK